MSEYTAFLGHPMEYWHELEKRFGDASPGKLPKRAKGKK